MDQRRSRPTPAGDAAVGEDGGGQHHPSRRGSLRDGARRATYDLADLSTMRLLPTRMGRDASMVANGATMRVQALWSTTAAMVSMATPTTNARTGQSYPFSKFLIQPFDYLLIRHPSAH
ncbi:hypothetical protein D1007_01227 [Hordeum vulgare]|nr:hypothetical protein D1007_01227 [Hordeum vulgare]